jgi:hypothetical protein
MSYKLNQEGEKLLLHIEKSFYMTPIIKDLKTKKAKHNAIYRFKNPI